MENYNNPIKAGMLNGPDPSEMKMQVTSPGKELQQTEVLAEGKENMEWVVE